MLLLHQSKVKRLAVNYGPNPLTKELKKVHTRRLEYAGFISTQLKFLAQIGERDLKHEIHIAQSVARFYLFGIRKKAGLM